MTLSEYLRGLTNYPVPEEALRSILSKRGVSYDANVLNDDKLLCLVTADLYSWVALAPDVSQGGQSYSILFSVREYYRKRANELYRAGGEPVEEVKAKVRYGYKGERL